MQQLNFKIEDFEGPLDLLLHLISKNKMNILDIEILVIINQYLEIIKDASANDLDIASDFIDMAARLIYLKSAFLLPKDEEAEKLKAELQGQLIEYSQAKIAAEYLKKVFIGDKLFTRGQQQITEDLTYDIIHPIQDIVNAYSVLDDKSIRRMPPKQEKFDTIVTAPIVSVQAKIYTLLKSMMKKNFTTLCGAFSQVKSKSEAVATFLALLELLRAKRISIDGEGNMSLNKKSGRKYL